MTRGDRPWNELADELGIAAVADGEPTRWYDELWSAGARGDVPLPWDRTTPHPFLPAFAEALGPGAGRRAVVVGCGLGGDSEYLAAQGWATTAFDISVAAVAAVRDRYPDSPVDYRVGNLLDPGDLGTFDLVVEIYTVQALHPSLRDQAGSGVRALLAPGGRALVVQAPRGDDEAYTPEPPWTLTRAEMEAVAGDLEVESLEQVPAQDGSGRRWRMVLWRP